MSLSQQGKTEVDVNEQQKEQQTQNNNNNVPQLGALEEDDEFEEFEVEGNVHYIEIETFINSQNKKYRLER